MRKAGNFRFDMLTDEKAQEELSSLRSGRGGRTSKYGPLAAAAEKLGDGQVLRVKLKKNEVGGLRGYLQRRFGEKYEVRSSKAEKETYVAFVSSAGE